MVNFEVQSDVADQCDKLKLCISNNGFKSIRTITIVSSTQCEGSSTVAINFAVNLAVNHKARILLVDGNIRNPVLHKAFYVEQENGLTDLLLGEADFNAVLKSVAIPGLFLITSGKIISNPNQLFGSVNLDEVLLQKAEQFDYILLDCPPVNLYPETMILISQCDGVVLVVHAGKTRREIVCNAISQIINAKANILGVVLNRRKYYIPRWLYNWL